MKSIDLLYIDPPMKRFFDSTFLYGNLYQSDDKNSKVFNPGLLSIASYLLEEGYSVKVVHILNEENIAPVLESVSREVTPKVIAVSCGYMHTYLPTIEISKLLSRLFPAALLIAGGQHIGDIAGFALEETCFDVIIQGEGEYAVRKIMEFAYGKRKLDTIGNLYFRDEFAEKHNVKGSSSLSRFEVCDFIDSHSQRRYTPTNMLKTTFKEALMPLDEMPFLHYELYDNYLEYPPYLEESRGCYGKCKYCVSAVECTYRYKSADRFLSELDYVVGIYGTEIVYPFTAANLGVNVNNTIQIFEGIIQRYGSLKWISEFRLDLHWEKYIDLMYQSGCVSYGIGLESASPEILQIMSKTTNPEKYLEKAERLIKQVVSYPKAYVHLNFMFYLGESPQSMADNMRFISKHFDDISIVHYSPIILYAGTEAWNNFEEYHKQFGSTIVKTPVYDSMHAYPVNVSRLFTYTDACYFSRIVEKMFLETEGYMVNHETRVSRDKEGKVTEESKQAYIRRMIES